MRWRVVGFFLNRFCWRSFFDGVDFLREGVVGWMERVGLDLQASARWRKGPPSAICVGRGRLGGLYCPAHVESDLVFESCGGFGCSFFC